MQYNVCVPADIAGNADKVTVVPEPLAVNDPDAPLIAIAAS